MVEPGGIASSPDGRLWRVLKVGEEKVVFSKLRGPPGVFLATVERFHTGFENLPGLSSLI